MSSQKRISAPRTYNIKRKHGTWIARVNPGPHDKNALPLNVLLRDILGVVRNAKEARRTLNDGKVLVDGMVRKNSKFPVGFMDVVSIPLMKKHFRIVFDNIGRLKCVPISSKESGLKIVQIKGKARKDKGYYLTTNDGRTLIVKLIDGKKYKTKDSLLIKVPSQDIVKHLPFVDGALAYVVGGKQVGAEAVLSKIKERYAKIMVGEKEHRTVKRYIFIVGVKKPELKLGE